MYNIVYLYRVFFRSVYIYMCVQRPNLQYGGFGKGCDQKYVYIYIYVCIYVYYAYMMHYDVLRRNEKLQVISDVSGVLSARHKGAPSGVVPGCHWNELSSLLIRIKVINY